MSAQAFTPVSQPAQSTGFWTTTPFECMKDEETCWWGTWCCCLLSARTAESFGVGSSSKQSSGFVAFILISIVLTIVFPPLGLPLLIAGLIYYAYYKADLRSKIRNILNIPGTLMSDFILHCFCPLCAVAQEAREANSKDLKRLDFWYGEELSSISFPQVERGGYVSSSPTNAAVEEGSSVSLIEHLKTISKFSHLILRMWLSVVAATFIALLIAGRGLSFLVLILVFVQPFLILYFVYWRNPDRSKHVSLDYVIKLFAVGFFMSTTQSIVFESILESILGFVVGVVLLLLNPDMNNNDDGNNNTDNSTRVQIVQLLRPYFSKDASWTALLTGAYYTITNTFAAPTEYSSTIDHTYTTTATADQYASADGYIYYPLASRSLTGSTSNTTDDSESGFTPELMRKNFFIVIIALFIMAFVIAAGVEETMKHFAVRCCRFPALLRDPHSVLVYLMTAALGFATSENIEYVFGTNRSPLPGTSLLVGELFVLLIRILMPVHVICSVLQATSLSKVLMGASNSTVVEILLPAILLHGSFDFVLFLMGAIQTAFTVNEVAMGVFSYLLPVGITLFGVYLAYTGFNKVIALFESGWQSVAPEPGPEVYV